MEFKRSGNQHKSLGIGEYSLLREFYDELSLFNIVMFSTKEGWQSFDSFDDGKIARQSFDLLHKKLREKSKQHGYRLYPMSVGSNLNRQVQDFAPINDYELTQHIWFAVPQLIREKALNQAYIDNYFDLRNYTLLAGSISMGAYLTFTIFQVCCTELNLSEKQMDYLGSFILDWF